MKGIEEQLRGEFSSLTKRDLHALCRRSEVQPKVVTDWIEGKKSITLRTVDKLLNEKNQGQ